MNSVGVSMVDHPTLPQKLETRLSTPDEWFLAYCLLLSVSVPYCGSVSLELKTRNDVRLWGGLHTREDPSQLIGNQPAISYQSRNARLGDCLAAAVNNTPTNNLQSLRLVSHVDSRPSATRCYRPEAMLYRTEYMH